MSPVEAGADPTDQPTPGASTDPASPSMRPGVFLALSPGAIHPAPVQAALDLAAARKVGLAVAVLSAERYNRAASLPFTREFRLSCGAYRDFGPNDVEATLAGQMRRLVRYLAQAGRDRAVHWMLDTAPRPLASMLREYRQAGGLTLVDSAPWLAAAGQDRRFARVVVLLDDSLAALEVAATVCGAGRATLCLIGTAADAHRLAAQRETIAASLASLGLATLRGGVRPVVALCPPERVRDRLAAELGGRCSLLITREAELVRLALDEADLSRRVGTSVLVLP